MYEAIVFYAFGAILVVSGALVVTARNPVHGVLFLVLSFFTAAAIWLLLRAEFLAIALVVVYVGAVMVLFLFVVMMLDINLERVRQGFWRNLPLAAVVGGIMVAEMVAILLRARFAENVQPLPPGYSNTKAIGRVLYTDYAYAFEIAAVLLLVAIVSAIALTLRKRKDTRAQDVSEQLRARPAERVRLVSIPAERDS
ncbi:MAG TPA: NADH-quinone oxidoreductase subunit J [Burkholderiales bacterium]|nr:NADH-quinone oxidoreductase subunit J [Burkholderiales bacterium]